MDKDALTIRERDAWAALRGIVDGLTPEQREVPGVNGEGWTVKDVLWHIAHWWGHLAELLDQMREGTFVEPPEDDAATDSENARVLEESRAMRPSEVERGLDVTRGRMLEAWTGLPELTEPAERWFVWETIEHYEEHLPGVRALADA